MIARHYHGLAPPMATSDEPMPDRDAQTSACIYHMPPWHGSMAVRSDFTSAAHIGGKIQNQRKRKAIISMAVVVRSFPLTRGRPTPHFGERLWREPQSSLAPKQHTPSIAGNNIVPMPSLLEAAMMRDGRGEFGAALRSKCEPRKK